MNLLLTFILCFPYSEDMLNPLEPTDDNRVKKKKKGKKRENTPTVETNSDSESKIAFSEDMFVRPSPNLKRVYDIQYQLPLLEEKKKEIKVVYLGTCAEVRFQDVFTTVKSNIIEDKAFVLFTISHHIRSKEHNAPVQILSHDIKFDFKQGKDSSKAKVNNKLFYFFKDNNNGDFGYLAESMQGSIPHEVKHFTLKTGANDYLFVRPCKFHWKRANILIKNASNEIDSRIVLEEKCGVKTEVIFPQEEAVKPKSKASSKKDKLEKIKRKLPILQLTVSGQKLVFEKSVWVFEEFNADVDGEILYAGLIVTNTDIYTSKQRSVFKPLFINVKSIQNMPPSIKENHKVDKVCLEYSYPPLCKNVKIGPVEFHDQSNIKIKYVRTFFTHSLSEEKLIEAFQNNLLTVKILGLKDIEEEVTPRVWGQDLSCTDFSRRFSKFIDISEAETKESTKSDSKKDTSAPSAETSKNSKKKKKLSKEPVEETNEETIVLGFASISLYDLLKYSQRTVVSAPVRTSFLPTSNSINLHIRPMNVMHFHRDYRRPQRSVVRGTEFTDYKTILKVEAKVGYDLARFVLPRVLTLPNLFTVCIIIDYKVQSCYRLLKEVLEHNISNIPEGRTMPNVLYQHLGVSPEIHPGKKIKPETIPIDYTKSKEGHLKNQNYFTGFMIDAIDFSILMLEGLEIQTVPKIMVHRYQMSTDEGRILYNSNIVFTERLYDEFLKFGGVFVSALGLPMDSVLSHNRVHEYVPAPALRCLQNLKAVTTSKSIRRDLFPTPLELLSMDVEFGIPLHQVDTFKKYI